MNEKKVIDVACGGRMFYFDKNDPRVLFCDNRTVDTILCDGRHFIVAPDIQCNFTALPFKDGSFKLVVYDPPHLLYNTGKSKTAEIYGSLNPAKNPTGYQHIKYGSLQTGWREMLAKGFSECFRVLEPNGILIFKWNETDIPVREILKLTDNKPLFGNRSGKASKTHWICFIKDALRAQLEQENPKPLTLDELREMDGEPIWCVSIIAKKSEWAILRIVETPKTWLIAVAGAAAGYGDKDTYGKTWLAYRNRPKEEN